MPKQVSHGALMICSFGAAPSALVVLPKNRVFAEGPPAANILDHIPLLNIQPFGMCSALMGPCVPATSAPWSPGAPTVKIAKAKALDNVSKCVCSIGGQISFIDSATVKTMIP